MNKKVIFIFILSVLFFGIKSVNAETNKMEELSKGDNPYTIKNPLWNGDYQGSKYGVVLNKYVVPYDERMDLIRSVKSNSYNNAMALPSSYDLRNVNGTNYVTPLKDQATLGLCWAFTTISSMETYLLKHNMVSSSTTFNERQLDYATAYAQYDTFLGTSDFLIYSDAEFNSYYVHYYDEEQNATVIRNLGSGGNFSYAGYVLSKGVAPVRQEGSSTWNSYWTGTKNNERQMSLSQVFNTNDISYSVTGYIEYPLLDLRTASSTVKTSYINKIKNQIVENGSVYVSTVAPNSEAGSCSIYDTNRGTYLVNWTNNCGSGIEPEKDLHAMSIIGWDDNYSLSYCVSGSSTRVVSNTSSCNSNEIARNVNGAWILKNSWGNVIPYLYLAYDSYATQFAGITTMVQKDWSQNYDSVASLVNKEQVGSGYVFTYSRNSLSNETLKRISLVHYAQSNKTFTISIDANNDGNFVSLGTLTSDIPGMISLSTFSSDVTLTSNTFKIKITGSGTEFVDSISIFTNYNNVTNTKSISAKVYDDNYLKYNDYKTMFIIAISARNYGTGASFTQSIFNKNTNMYISNPRSIFGFEGMLNMYNDALVLNINFFNNDMPYGDYEYHLRDTSGNVLARCDFSIKPTVTYNTDRIVLDIGETFSTLGYSIDYNNGSSANPSSTIGYRSDNTDIATFTNGVIRGISSGDTTVGLTVTIDDITFYYPLSVSVGEIGFGDYIVDGSYLFVPANITKAVFEENIRVDGCTLEYSPNNNFLSTGMTLTIRKNNSVKGIYTIIVLGDVNSDGRISIADVSRLYNHFMSIIQINDANQRKAGDVNKDSRISIADVSRLYNYFMNIIPEL